MTTLLFTAFLILWVGTPIAAYYHHLRAYRMCVMERDFEALEAKARAWAEEADRAELARLDAEALAAHDAYYHAYDDDETEAERWLAFQDEILQDLQAQRDSCADLA